MRFPIAMPQHQRRRRHTILKNIWRSAGRKDACAAGTCFVRSKPAATLAVFRTSSACWPNGAAQTQDRAAGAARSKPAGRRSGDRAVDLPDHRCRALHQAARIANKRSGSKVDALKSHSQDFAAMRRLAMRFRGILRSKKAGKLGILLKDALHSGLYAMQRFARTLRRDIDAVKNAITECWNNGQAEGQINRLKTLKRAMYGRAGSELLRARMLPIEVPP
jgi:hypothetical protein